MFSTRSRLSVYIYFCSIFQIIPKAHHHKPMSNGIKIQLTCSASPKSLLPWAAKTESRMSHEAKMRRDEEKTMEINRSVSLGLWSWRSSASSLLTFFFCLSLIFHWTLFDTTFPNALTLMSETLIKTLIFWLSLHVAIPWRAHFPTFPSIFCLDWRKFRDLIVGSFWWLNPWKQMLVPHMDSMDVFNTGGDTLWTAVIKCFFSVFFLLLVYWQFANRFVHIATHYIGLYAYATILGHGTKLRIWKMISRGQGKMLQSCNLN